MKIQPTNFNLSTNTAKHREIMYGHKSSYSYLKNVRGNCCACCGKPMILSEDISAIWGKITRPLIELFKEGRFDFAETVFPPIYKVLKQFTKKYPEESLDSVVTDSGNHYIFMTSIEESFKNDAEYKVLSGQQQQKKIKGRTMELFRISSAILKDSAIVVENLKPLESYLYGYRKDILQELEFLSGQYPDKKLNEIIKLPDVAEKYIEGTYNDALEFAQIRDEHWNKVNKIILDKAPELESLLNKLKKQVCLIYRGVVNPARVTYEIREAYTNFLNEHKLFNIKESVLTEISQMPACLFSKNSFLSFARRYYTDGEIVNYVIKPFMESIEHIDAVSGGGTNAVSNIIMMCRQCNNDRKSYPYPEHLAIHPEMIINEEKQLRFYADKILTGELPDILEKYPIEVAKTLRRCSEGIMDYNMDYYIEALAKKHEMINS